MAYSRHRRHGAASLITLAYQIVLLLVVVLHTLYKTVRWLCRGRGNHPRQDGGRTGEPSPVAPRPQPAKPTPRAETNRTDAQEIAISALSSRQMGLRAVDAERLLDTVRNRFADSDEWTPDHLIREMLKTRYDKK